MDPRLIIAIFAVGLVLIGTEIFIPGMVVGIAGALCVGFSVYLAYTSNQTGLAFTLLGIGIVFVPVFMVLWYKVLGKFFSVSASAQNFSAAQTGLSELLNQEGVALTMLRPSGMANFGGKRVDVVTRGEMIERNTRVRVVKVEGNRVVVEALKL